MAMFKDTKMLDWGIGTSPLYSGRKVNVIGVNGNRRQVSWYVPGEPEPTKQWVDVKYLQEMPGAPIPPKKEPALAAEDEAHGAGDIAQKEMDLAQERDDLLLEIESLYSRLQTQTEVAEQALKQRDDALALNDSQSRLLQEATETMGKQSLEIKTLEASMLIPNRRRREMKVFTVPAGRALLDQELRQTLEQLDAEGWEIAYEDYDNGSYFARLIREGQGVIPPSQPDTRVALEAPTPETAGQALEDASEDIRIMDSAWREDDQDDEYDFIPDPDAEEPELVPEMVIVGLDDDPAWKKETDPVTRERMIYTARKQTLGAKKAGGFIAQQRGHEKRERAQGGFVNPDVRYMVGGNKPALNGVKVGPVVLDPAKFPILATLAAHGYEATTEALDNRIRERALAAMQTARAQRPVFVPLLLGQ